MTTERHRAIRAALVDVGVPIDRAEATAAELADVVPDEDDTGPERSWFGTAMAAGRTRRTVHLFGRPDDTDPPPDAA